VTSLNIRSRIRLDLRLGGRFGAIANGVSPLDHWPAPQPPPSRRQFGSGGVFFRFRALLLVRGLTAE
jgi:hypothetical protein